METKRYVMKRYIARRILWGLVVLWLVSIFIFVVTRVGADPVLLMADDYASEADLDILRKRFSLDKPYPVQYYLFVSQALRGDFGESLFFGHPVSEIIAKRLPASMELVGAAWLISLTIGISGGVLAARTRKGWLNNAIRVFSLFGLSMPNFWIALLALLLFSVHLQILPSFGRGGIPNLIMPACALGWYFSAGFTRLSYSSLLEVLNQGYIKMARVKGLSEAKVVGKHALKNAMIPIVTFAGMYFPIMIGGAVAIETVFAWPGLGFLLYEAAISRDFNTVQGVVLIMSVMMVFINLLVDILYAYLDPRIRYT